MIQVSIHVFNALAKPVEEAKIAVIKPKTLGTFSEGIDNISPPIKNNGTGKFTYSLLLDTDIASAKTILNNLQFVLSWKENGEEKTMNISTFSTVP